MKRKHVIGILALVAIAGTLFLILRNQQDTNDKAVLFAANLPLTGDLAVYGEAVKRGVELAQDDFQSQGSVGKRIVVDWQDNASDAKTAASVMQKQLLKQPKLYMSGVRPQTMAIWEGISGANVPHFVWIFERIINPDRHHRNNFRTWVNLKDEAKVYLEYVNYKQAKRVAILHAQLPSYQDEFDKDVIPALKEQGVEVFVDTYPFDGADYRTLSARVKEFKPDLTILGGLQTHLVGLVRAMRPLNLIRDGNTITTYDLLDASEVLGPDELEGIRLVAPTFVSRPNEKKVVSWTAKFERKFRVSPLYTDAYAYDMMLVIQDAVSRLPETPTYDDWINSIRATDIEGVTGPLRFDADGSLFASIEVAFFQNGKVTPETDNVPVEIAK